MEVNENGQPSASKYQFISDDGNTEYYGDGVASKDLAETAYQKYRSDVITSSSPLPIILEYFTARPGLTSTFLSWKVSEPSDISSFEVLRSVTGATFKSIATVAARGGVAVFNYTDTDGSTSAYSYYQLKLLMRNGAVIYSPVRMISTTKNDIVKVYPNPVVNGRFSISTNYSGQKQAQLIALNGVVVRSILFDDISTDVDVTGLPAGNYLLTVWGKQGKLATRKLVIGR